MTVKSKVAGAAVAVTLGLAALACPASAANLPPTPRNARYVCPDKSGPYVAKVSKDRKWVTCPGGRQYRAGAGKIFLVIAGVGVFEEDSGLGGLLGPVPPDALGTAAGLHNLSRGKGQEADFSENIR